MRSSSRASSTVGSRISLAKDDSCRLTGDSPVELPPLMMSNSRHAIYAAENVRRYLSHSRARTDTVKPIKLLVHEVGQPTSIVILHTNQARNASRAKRSNHFTHHQSGAASGCPQPFWGIARDDNPQTPVLPRF